MKQKIHLLKVSLSHTVIIFVSLLIIFRLKRAFASFSIPYPEKNIRFPHGHPTTSSGQFWAYQVNQLLDTIRLGSPITPTGMRVVSYIHAPKLMYVLLSSSTMALRNFLPIAVYDDAFFRSSRSLTNTNLSLAFVPLEVMASIRLYLLCNPPHRYR